MKNITKITLFSLVSGLTYAQPANNSCASAIVLTVGAPCTNGTTVAATTQLGENSPACWLTAASTTVWYKFTTGAAGTYNVSLDNGGSMDSQIALYSNTCPGSAATMLACSEDDGTSNTLAGFVSANLAASTTYLIQVDTYSTGTGTFCINVNQVVTPPNDCIFSATDITSQINTLSSTNLFECAPFTYNPAGPGGDPTRDNLAGDPNGCNGSLIVVGVPPQVPNPDHRDVWFKFTVDGTTPPAWLSLYQQTGTTPNYSTAIYSGTPGGTCGSGGSITGMTQIDCSAGEYVDAVLPGSNIDGGARDMADCTTPIHPRIDVSALPNGTYYFRVWESFGGAPSDGEFNLCAESATPAGVTSDGCPSQNTVGCLGSTTNANFTNTYSDLGNNGMTGNSCNTAINEPQLAAGAAGQIRDACGGAWVTQVGYANNVMNNSAIYQFTIDATAPCQANVLLEFSNIEYGGTNGNVAQIQVMNGTCVGGTSAIMTGTTSQSCLEMRPVGSTLPSGVYYIVVDGQDGQLLQYDMNLTVTHTGIGCTPTVCDPIVLGAEFDYFDVYKIEAEKIKVLWGTVFEEKNDYFEVERTYDGKTFESVATLKAKGSSTNLNKYESFDWNIDPTKDVVYYRIKQVDFDGNHTYSSLRSITIEKNHIQRVKKLNMLGQAVDDNYAGFVIEVFSDGTSKKIYNY